MDFILLENIGKLLKFISLLYVLQILSISTSDASLTKGFTTIKQPLTADWESLDQRKPPRWYDEAKFGIFAHWGLYSVPAFGSEWFWQKLKGYNGVEPKSNYVDFMANNYLPGFTYAKFAPRFRATGFDPNKWADIVKSSGARYFVFTSKHHDGYTNWPSKQSWNWNSVDNGPGRDIIRELADAFKRRTKVKFCLYFSLYEWFNPLYIEDRENNYETQNYVKAKVMPQLHDLVNQYQPQYIWSDGDWEADSSYWNSTQFLEWLYNESPVKDTVLVNDRWGSDANGKHGDVKTVQDRYNPKRLRPFKFENALTIDRESWGYRKEADMRDYLTIEEIIRTLVETVSCGGNMLLNVGPNADGYIPPIYEERLRQMGKWLAVNGLAIYKTKPWIVQRDVKRKDIWFTKRKNTVFAFLLRWPRNSNLHLRSPKITKYTKIRLLGVPQTLPFKAEVGGGLSIDLSDIGPDQLPCQWAWVVAMDFVK